MRLIDADALLKQIRIRKPLYRTDVEKLIKGAPTVDAVQVVRCKDCKWSESNHDYEDGYFCHHISHNQRWEVFSLCFCNYGERREP